MVDIIKPDTPTHPGGRDFTLYYTAEQAAALGADAELMADALDSALWALAALRSPGRTWGAGLPAGHTATSLDWAIAIRDLADLAAHTDEILRRAMIAHAEAGGSLAQLGEAMCVARSTAQDRLSAARARAAVGGPLAGWAIEEPDPADPIRGWRRADLADGAQQ